MSKLILTASLLAVLAIAACSPAAAGPAALPSVSPSPSEPPIAAPPTSDPSDAPATPGPADPSTPAPAPWLYPLLALHPIVPQLVNRLARRVTEPWVQPIARLRVELGLPKGLNPLFEGQHSPQLVVALFSHHFGEKQPDHPAQTVVTGFPFFDGAERQPPPPELMKFLDE